MPDVGPWRLGAARGGPAERRQFEPAQPCFEVGGQRGCSRAHDTSPAVVAYSSRRRLGTLGRSTTSASPGLEGRGTPLLAGRVQAQLAAPPEPVVAKADTVYLCPECEGRYLGEQ